jgi:hypothetical protein
MHATGVPRVDVLCLTWVLRQIVQLGLGSFDVLVAPYAQTPQDHASKMLRGVMALTVDLIGTRGAEACSRFCVGATLLTYIAFPNPSP